MKSLLMVIAVLTCTSAFANKVEEVKTKTVETKTDVTTEVKKKACPVVNGKEDCTVEEVKTKAIEVKNKLTK